jgi:replicative DNA helicase
MKIQRNKEGLRERRIVISMITDTPTLAGLSDQWRGDNFAARWSNLVGGWCVKYYLKYGKAPGKDIQGLFTHWAEKGRDDDTVEVVDSFLSSLSGQYEQESEEANSPYLIDLAVNHFNQVSAERLSESIKGDLTAGDLEKALERIQKFKISESGTRSVSDVLQDMALVERAFSKERSAPLFTLPGPAGEFFGKRDVLCRGGFVSFMAPTSRGKSYWLMKMAWHAMLSRKRVAFFQVGDLDEEQMMVRWCRLASQRPIRKGEYKIPISLKVIKKKCKVKYRTRTYKTPLNATIARKALEKVAQQDIKSSRPYLKMSTHPSGSISVTGIRSRLEKWAREDWNADVVVIDYADLLSPVDQREDGRERINTTWKTMKGLSNEFRCLVITATQSDAASYGVRLLSRNNFADDRRKLDHVFAMVGINQTGEEKGQGVQRLNYLKVREDEYTEDRELWCAGCLALADPCLVSTF